MAGVCYFFMCCLLLFGLSIVVRGLRHIVYGRAFAHFSIFFLCMLRSCSFSVMLVVQVFGPLVSKFIFSIRKGNDALVRECEKLNQHILSFRISIFFLLEVLPRSGLLLCIFAKHLGCLTDSLVVIEII